MLKIDRKSWIVAEAMLLFAIVCVAIAIAMFYWTAQSPRHAITVKSGGWIVVSFKAIWPVVGCLIIWLITRGLQSRLVRIVATVPIALALAFSALFATMCILEQRPLLGATAYDEAIAEAGDALGSACRTFEDDRAADRDALSDRLPNQASPEDVRKKLKLHQEALQDVTADRAFLQQWPSHVSRIFATKGVSDNRAQTYAREAVSPAELQRHINQCTELEVTLKARIEKLNAILTNRP